MADSPNRDDQGRYARPPREPGQGAVGHGSVPEHVLRAIDSVFIEMVNLMADLDELGKVVVPLYDRGNPGDGLGDVE